MKKLIFTFSLIIALAALNSSCEQAIEDNIGNPYVLMSWANITINFTDTLKVTGIDTLYSGLKDTTLNSIGVYRSGLSGAYPEINLNVKIDSVYLKSMIQQANDPLIPDVQKSGAVLNFKNAILLPASCYKFTPAVKIENDQRVGNVSLVVYKTKFARLNATKIFLPIAIDTLSVSGVNKQKMMSIVQMKKSFIIRKL
jgi:hypothetical protein